VNGHPPIINDDVDYLVEDNAMDDICLSPELDGTLGVPTFEHSCDIKTSEKSNSRKMTQR
jgi:DNA-directed RNA polymerase-5 subunit 1